MDLKNFSVSRKTTLALLFVILIAMSVAFGVSLYNDIQARDETVKASWSEVLNMYRRRADLLPNVIAVVRAYAAHERELLVELADARAAVLQGLNSDNGNHLSLQRLQQSQEKFALGLSHLLAISERYPELKANTLFQELIIELEGSENRISYARGRFIEAVAANNLAIRSFPGNLIAKAYGFKIRPNFNTDDVEAIQRAPVVKVQ
jgi:LemA protein